MTAKSRWVNFLLFPTPLPVTFDAKVGPSQLETTSPSLVLEAGNPAEKGVAYR